jgi:hypothetical protein
MDAIGRERRITGCGCPGVLGDESLDGVGAEPPPGSGREQRFFSEAAPFDEPSTDHGPRRGVEGDGPVLAAFAEAADVGAVAECDVAVVEAGELADAEPGLGGEGEHGTVSSSFPTVPVRGGEQAGELGLGEERDLGAVEPFGRDGQHAADQLGVFGVSERRVGEQRSDGGEPQVPGSGRVVPLLLEVVEERRDGAGVEVGPVEPMGLDPLGVVDPGEEQAERVPVGDDCPG